MYAGESAVYLSGHHASDLTLPVPANEHLPVLLSEKTMTLRSALNIHGLLRQLIHELNGEHVPGHIAAVTREAAIRSVRDIDTAWALSLVEKFHGVSTVLGLGMDAPDHVAQMEETLMTSLGDDILEGDSLYFIPYRVSAVRKSLGLMGVSFTAAHGDRIAEWVYERTTDVLRLGGGDLRETMDNADRIVNDIDRALRYGG